MSSAAIFVSIDRCWLRYIYLFFQQKNTDDYYPFIKQIFEPEQCVRCSKVKFFWYLNETSQHNKKYLYCVQLEQLYNRSTSGRSFIMDQVLTSFRRFRHLTASSLFLNTIYCTPSRSNPQLVTVLSQRVMRPLTNTRRNRQCHRWVRRGSSLLGYHSALYIVAAISVSYHVLGSNITHYLHLCAR